MREEESESIYNYEGEGEREGSSSAHLSSSSLFLVLFFTSIPLHNNHRFSAGTEWLTIGSPSLAPGISSSVICTVSGSTRAHCDEVDGCAMVLECVEELYGKKKFRFKDEFEQWSLPPAETMFHEEPFEVSKLLKLSLPGTRNNMCVDEEVLFPGPTNTARTDTHLQNEHCRKARSPHFRAVPRPNGTHGPCGSGKRPNVLYFQYIFNGQTPNFKYFRHPDCDVMNLRVN